ENTVFGIILSPIRHPQSKSNVKFLNAAYKEAVTILNGSMFPLEEIFMRRSRVFWCLVVLFCLVSGLLGYSQSASTATLRGRVVDPQDAVVPNATVTATNAATGISR